MEKNGHNAHQTRHSFITEPVRAGEDINVIQSLSGHSSADMILRYSSCFQLHLPKHSGARTNYENVCSDSYTLLENESNRLSKEGWSKCKCKFCFNKVMFTKGCGITIKEKMLEIIKDNGFFSLESPKWSRLTVNHIPWNTQEEFKKVGKMILKTIGKSNGIYVYTLNNEILYIGKGNPIYGRIKSHYEECYRQPTGDRTGRWHKFFSQHIGTMEIQWRVVDDQGVQLFVENAMTEHFKPKFVTFKG